MTSDMPQAPVDGKQELNEISALDAAKRLLGDVDSLLDHHPAQRDPKPGKPTGPGYGPLLRAGTALCYTAWEVYVEEALLETTRCLLDNDDAQNLPSAMRSWAVEQSRDPWAFVGDSWKATVMELLRSRLEGDEQGRNGFNSASVPKVEGLYKQILGYSPIRDIRWPKRSNQSVREQISLLVHVRGEIVHRGSTPGALTLGGVRGWASFVRRLTEKFDERLVAFRVPIAVHEEA